MNAALADHFRYPLLARRRGWEGKVLLAFRIEPDGLLGGVRVIRGSGHRLLDGAAMESLQKVKRVDVPPGMLTGGLDLELPVEYRLTEG